MAAYYTKQGLALESREAQDYQDRLGERIAARMDHVGSFRFIITMENPCQWKPQALATPFSLPGGYLIVPAPAILAAQSEDELAGALAHSMVHTVLGQMTEPRRPGMIPVTETEDCSNGKLSIRWSPAARLSHEIQADSLAIKALSHSGFDPRAFLAYIERGADTESIRRAAEMRTAVARWPVANAVSSSGDFAQFQDVVRRAVETANAPPQPHALDDEPPILRRPATTH